MPDDRAKNFEVEKVFTQQDYSKFVNAVKAREYYEFFFGKKGTYLPCPNTRISITIRGRKCDNGIWKDDYLYSVGCSRNNGGCSSPYDPVKKVLTYEEIIDELYKGLGIARPQQRQITLFDMGM